MSCLVTRQAKTSAAHALQRRHLYGCQKERRGQGEKCVESGNLQGLSIREKWGPRTFLPTHTCLLRAKPGRTTQLCRYEHFLFTLYWSVKFAGEVTITIYHKNPDSYRITSICQKFYSLPGLPFAQVQICVFEKVVDLSVTKCSSWWFWSGDGADWPRTRVKHRNKKPEMEMRTGSSACICLSQSVGVCWILLFILMTYNWALTIEYTQ